VGGASAVVANGGVTYVSYRGQTKVYLTDLLKHNHSVLVTLHNVLYVPGLTRRLISVLEWKSCGGHISYLSDRIRLDVFDQQGILTTSIETPPIYSTTGTTQLNMATLTSVMDVMTIGTPVLVITPSTYRLVWEEIPTGPHPGVPRTTLP
jgi:hypothetical protein